MPSVIKRNKTPSQNLPPKKERKKTETAKLEGGSMVPLFLSSLAVAVFAVIYYIYVYNVEGGGSEVAFVTAKQRVLRAVIDVPCSKDYEKEPFKDCKPKRCARVVMDDVVTENEAKHLRSVAVKGLALGGSNGGASILDLHSGALSQGKSFVNVYSLLSKLGTELFTEEDFLVYSRVKAKIHKAIATEFNVKQSSLYLTKPTFFSRMNTTPPSTVHDEYWHPHIDKVTYGSFHYTSLLYLSTYGEEFQGGRFIFVDKNSNRTVEPRLGRVSFFTSGSENLHFVEKLLEGIRYAITISFTCDPKQAIDDPVLQKGA